MRYLTSRSLWTVCLGLLLSPVLAVGAEKKEESGCGSFGTKLEFVATPSKAAQLAKKQGKLVFVLHVSGHFEDPRFT